VPDSDDQFTSDHGWAVDAMPSLRSVIEEAHALGARVSLFMDPDPGAMRAAREAGADRIELYTESYARAHAEADPAAVLARFAEAAAAAQAVGLGVNAGHDLNRANLADFLHGVPGVLEVSIGHALIADALDDGLAQTVRNYLAAIGKAA
jgi:pyridoxine 5-phosphate synthase